MNNDLLLQSKNDVPFVECQVNIHQPTISEISIIGEESFRTGLQFLNFNKSQLSEEDQANLFNQSDFTVLMMILSSKEHLKYKIDAMFVLTLLFPKYQIRFKENGIELQDGEFITLIDEPKYKAFQDIVNVIFGNEIVEAASKYNPADARAAKIAEKLKKHDRKLAKKNGEAESDKISVYARYVSILSVGLQKDKNELMDYTVSQLLDEFERFQLKESWDMYKEAKMAGAKDLDEVDNWMKELHP